MQLQVRSCSTAARAVSTSRVVPFSGVAKTRSCIRPATKQSVREQQASVLVCRAAQVEDEDKLKLTGGDDEELVNSLPKGYHWYETMMVLKPTLSDEERDKELAKFEAFLNKEDCMHINALVRSRSRMAYRIKNHWEGIYVLYNYAAKRQTARTIQLLLSTPEAGSEDNVLRHITFCKL